MASALLMSSQGCLWNDAGELFLRTHTWFPHSEGAEWDKSGRHPGLGHGR